MQKYKKDCKYLVACSGGPDSMALLDMLRSSNYKLDVAFVNYKTRKESDDEQKLVEDYCAKYHISFHFLIAPTLKTNNFENEARILRYNFFSEVYFKINASGLFVAHHKDDLLETYLLKKKRNVINESLLIKSKTMINKMVVYRPLLKKYYKEDLLNYCKNNNIPYGIDYTNFLDIHERNIIRKKIATLDKDKLYKKAINEERKLINTRKDVKEFIKYYPVYEVSKLLEKDELWLRIFLYESASSKYKKYVNKSVYLSLLDFLNSDKPNLSKKVYKDYYLVKNYKLISYKIIKNIDYSYKLDSLEYLKTKEFKIVSNGLKMQGIYVNENDFPITIKNASGNEYIKLKEGSKKISRLFIDKKVPKEKRNQTLIILNKDSEVIFVYGLYRKYGLKYVDNNLFISLNY